MDDFGDNFVQPEVDPAAEFLAREQNTLAGLEEELETGAPPPIVSSSSNGLVDDFVGVYKLNFLLPSVFCGYLEKAINLS